MTPRHKAIVSLVPKPLHKEEFRVDIGADHGWVARQIGAFAVERLPHRRAGQGRWVIADGLSAFTEVDLAVIAGMGARRIAKILDGPCRPTIVIVAPQDDPPWLRNWLALRGWRIDAEVVAPEAGGYAEILRIVNGVETASGLSLRLGPHLLNSDVQEQLELRVLWAAHRASVCERIARMAPVGSLAFLEASQDAAAFRAFQNAAAPRACHEHIRSDREV